MIENILTYSIGSLFWGILIAFACIGLFLFLIKGWYKDAYFNLISYIIAGILCIILIYNCTIICGAIAMKSDLNFFEALIAQAINLSFSDYDMIVNQETSNEILQQAIKKHPILNYYIGSGDFSGWKLSELPHVMAETLKSYLNKLILRRVLWSLGFVIIGAILATKTISRSGRSGKSSSSRSKESRSNHSRPTTRGRRPVARRR